MPSLLSLGLHMLYFLPPFWLIGLMWPLNPDLPSLPSFVWSLHFFISNQSFDAKRTWFYFPMFSFLEQVEIIKYRIFTVLNFLFQNVDGRIPNVFELPLAPQVEFEKS